MFSSRRDLCTMSSSGTGVPPARSILSTYCTRLPTLDGRVDGSRHAGGGLSLSLMERRKSTRAGASQVLYITATLLNADLSDPEGREKCYRMLFGSLVPESLSSQATRMAWANHGHRKRRNVCQHG